MRQGGLYSITCQECREQGRDSVYYGESGRTLYDRGVEHLRAHQGRNPESVLVEHEVEEHEGRMVDWKMISRGFPRSNLMRQAREAHLITSNDHKNLLNRRGEWG